MNSRQSQAWFLIQCLRSQALLVEAGETEVEIFAWSARKPPAIEPEVMESIRCLTAEVLLILRLEQRIRLARADDRRQRTRRKKWIYKRRSK